MTVHGQKRARIPVEQWKSQQNQHQNGTLKISQAEEQVCAGNLELAETLYDCAAFSAKEHRFLNEEALANELAGVFYLKTGREAEAKVCFSHAIDCYSEWEALGKVKHLKRQLINWKAA